MSNNPNFYTNFGDDHFTFQSQYNMVPNFPPPPRPPNFIPPPPPLIMSAHPQRNQTPELRTPVSDQELLKRFEKLLLSNGKTRFPTTKLSISQVKDKLKNIVLSLNALKNKEKYLQENLSTLSDDNWDSTTREIEKIKNEINKKMSTIHDTLNMLGKLVAKRTAKRLRLKRVSKERQIEKKQRLKEMAERSRKIDENLQKIKDDIDKAKQEEESKIRADIMLKETLRKKNDAKKCIVKLDALVKLRRARQNTAKGRGESVSESDATSFNNNIEKLKSLWAQKLTAYEQEEMEMRAKLQDSTQTTTSGKEREVTENLSKWRHFLYGADVMPQIDFRGDIAAFVKVRCQWDQYISEEGSPIPIGWVTPH